ncbi:hypothetical protein NECAME_13351, partial [Necator americanus]
LQFFHLGIFTSFAGSGVDICIFSINTLLFRVSEKTATPTTVVIMGNVILYYVTKFYGWILLPSDLVRRRLRPDNRISQSVNSSSCYYGTNWKLYWVSLSQTGLLSVHPSHYFMKSANMI